MVGTDDIIAPQTTEHHFTEPVNTDQTTYSIERYTHQVPLDWFLIASYELDILHYEFYLEKKDTFDQTLDNYSVQAVDFDYEAEPNPDGTGKPFHILFRDSEDKERKCYPQTHYLLGLLDYDVDTYEVVAMTPADERDSVLVTIQECLPHVPSE